VRAESLYFSPVFACQIMNEGWASYWHARLLREAEFLPQPTYLAAIKAHSDVVRPFASGQETALAINPYHLGFTLWEKIVERHGMARARQVMREEDDFGFIRNYLDRDLAEKLALFVYEVRPGDEIRVANRGLGLRSPSMSTNGSVHGAACGPVAGCRREVGNRVRPAPGRRRRPGAERRFDGFSAGRRGRSRLRRQDRGAPIP